MASVNTTPTSTRTTFRVVLGDVERATLRALLGVVFCDENVVRPGWNRLTWDVQVLCTGDPETGWALTAHWTSDAEQIPATSLEWVEAELASALDAIDAHPVI